MVTRDARGHVRKPQHSAGMCAALGPGLGLVWLGFCVHVSGPQDVSQFQRLLKLQSLPAAIKTWTTSAMGEMFFFLALITPPRQPFSSL